MYEGYLELGGGEVLNSARSIGYTTTSGCSAGWLVLPTCDGVREMLGHDPYVYTDIADAPWYDEQDEPTHRFLGAYGVKIEGLPDSTREADVAEGIQDGGVVGRVRHATRRTRYEAMLTAIGEDALEVGFSWLSSALTPGRCGIHADACGAADARFYTACPPSSLDYTTPLPVWNDPVTNLAQNPSFESASATPTELRQNVATNPRAVNGGTAWSAAVGGTGAVATGAFVTTGGPLPDVPTYYRATKTVNQSSGSSWLRTQHGNVAVTANTVYTFSAYGRTSSASPVAAVRIIWLDSAGSTISESGGANGPAVANAWTRYLVTATAPATAAFARIVFGVSSSVAGDWVDMSAVLLEAAPSMQGYFDGATAPAGDFTYGWVGVANASVSTQSGQGVGYVPAIPITQGVVYLTRDTPRGGVSAMRYQLAGTGVAGIGVTNFVPDTGATYTLVGRVRPRMRDQSVVPRIRNAVGPAFIAPKDVWSEFRLTIAAGSGSSAQTGLLINNSSGHQAGDLIDVDEVMVVAGNYPGPYFDGSHPDSPAAEYEIEGAQLREFDWTGTPNASASTFRTGIVTTIPDPASYERALTRIARNLHTVTCVSGPTVIQKMHRDDTWGYLVEFVLVAAVPWMYGDTRPVDLQPSVPIVIQDVPFNLVPYPSAELADGSVVAATNYVKNPSIEFDTTDWALGSDGSVITSSALVLARTTELKAHGSASVRVKFTATTSGANGYFYVNTTVPLPALNSLTRFSANLWATASIESGTAVLGNLEHTIYWRNASNSTLRQDDIKTGPATGGAFSLKSVAPPPVGTTQAVLRALIRVTSFSSGAVIRLYADAAAVTVP